MTGPSQEIRITRCDLTAPCDSCENAAQFRMCYALEAEGGELTLCEEHLADLLCNDSLAMSLLVHKLAEMAASAQGALVLS